MRWLAGWLPAAAPQGSTHASEHRYTQHSTAATTVTVTVMQRLEKGNCQEEMPCRRPLRASTPQHNTLAHTDTGFSSFIHLPLGKAWGSGVFLQEPRLRGNELHVPLLGCTLKSIIWPHSCTPQKSRGGDTTGSCRTPFPFFLLGFPRALQCSAVHWENEARTRLTMVVVRRRGGG